MWCSIVCQCQRPAVLLIHMPGSFNNSTLLCTFCFAEKSDITIYVDGKKVETVVRDISTCVRHTLILWMHLYKA